MPEKISKAELLDKTQTEYDRFEALLAPLSEEQMVTPEVNGPWSVKDNIIHLTVWQDHLQSMLQAYLDGAPLPDFIPGVTTTDEANERIFQENKNRPLAEALSAFRASYQRTLAMIRSMSEEQLNSTLPWREDDRPILPFIVSNTCEHYQEHGDIIRDCWPTPRKDKKEPLL